MTVPYSVESRFGRSIKHLLLQWKGSIFKLVWPDLIIFLFLYFSISVLYRFGLNPEQQRSFAKISIYCEKYGTLIPVSFVLGFYVSLVIGRWWAQYKVIPWPDTMAMWVNTSIKGMDDEERLLRRTICRYTCLSITQCFTLISHQTKKRFPTLDHFIASGLLLEGEKASLENIVASLPKYQTHWIPLVWATNLVTQARFEGKINSDTWTKTIVDEIHKMKDACNLLLCFDRIRVPLVYTQVVTLAVYSYFLSCLMGRQWVHVNMDPDGGEKQPKTSGKYGVEELDLILPIFTVLQFLFYIGWLKVAESLVNPFGDDDYDFELNWMVDRHLQVCYTIVDKMHFKGPSLDKDPYWEEVVPPELPHTLASIKCHNDPPETSTATVVVSNKEREIVSPTLLTIQTIAKTNLKFRKRGLMAERKRATLLKEDQNRLKLEQEQRKLEEPGGLDGHLGGAGNGTVENMAENEIKLVATNNVV